MCEKVFWRIIAISSTPRLQVTFSWFQNFHATQHSAKRILMCLLPHILPEVFNPLGNVTALPEFNPKSENKNKTLGYNKGLQLSNFFLYQKYQRGNNGKLISYNVTVSTSNESLWMWKVSGIELVIGYPPGQCRFRESSDFHLQGHRRALRYGGVR